MISSLRRFSRGERTYIVLPCKDRYGRVPVLRRIARIDGSSTKADAQSTILADSNPSRAHSDWCRLAWGSGLDREDEREVMLTVGNPADVGGFFDEAMRNSALE